MLRGQGGAHAASTAQRSAVLSLLLWLSVQIILHADKGVCECYSTIQTLRECADARINCVGVRGQMNGVCTCPDQRDWVSSFIERRTGRGI